MRIIDVRQGSEEWLALRNRPTASEFSSFVTPARGQYSAQATAYAAKIIAKRLGVYTEPPPSFWMEWGTEQEPDARAAYQIQTGQRVTEVGFALPDQTDAYGCSPDGLVGDDGMIQIKCPAPETLIAYHAHGSLPDSYKPQVQGEMMICGKLWSDFWAWHPAVTPFLLRVHADESFQTKIAECLLMLLDTIDSIEKKMGLNTPQF